jgi:hypothetical protein
MKIFADKEGQEAVRSLCDIGLKVGGLKNLGNIQIILASLMILNKKNIDEHFKEKKEKE